MRYSAFVICTAVVGLCAWACGDDGGGNIDATGPVGCPTPGYTSGVDGTELRVDGNLVCVWDALIIETGFMCPGYASTEHDFSGYMACTESTGSSERVVEEMEASSEGFDITRICLGGCEENETCVERVCACVPQCVGRSCGDDGCGGTCGSCGDAEQCFDGQCCAPQCDGISCGGDGCGGSCECDATSTCVADPGSAEGQCVANVACQVERQVDQRTNTTAVAAFDADGRILFQASNDQRQRLDYDDEASKVHVEVVEHASGDVWQWVWTYDASGQPAAINTSWGNSETRSHNAAGDPLEESVDWDGDGVVDHHTVWSYDELENLLTIERDKGADGVVDSLATCSYEADGSRTEYYETLVPSAGVNYGFAPNPTPFSYVYDASGQLISMEQWDAGNLAARVSIADNPATRQILVETDLLGDGTIDYAATHVFNEWGNPISVESGLWGEVATWTYAGDCNMDLGLDVRWDTFPKNVKLFAPPGGGGFIKPGLFPYTR